MAELERRSNMSQEAPVIGVIACCRQVEGEPAQSVKHRYLEAVERYAHAVPVIIPSNQALANAAVVLSRLDAILLTGSNSNISPELYGSDATVRQPYDASRDGFAAALVHAAIAAGKPVIGICRGLQEINVALGGSLSDLRDSGSGAPTHHAPGDASLQTTFGHAHEAEVHAGSVLQRITGSGHLQVNSVHFQAIDRLAPGLVVNATSADGVIEAVSAAGTLAPVFAVQWHPEWRPEQRPHDLEFWNYVGEVARATYLPATLEPAV